MPTDITSLFSLSGRIALVTGSSSGIGLHTAQLLAEAGASVMLAARRRDKIEEAAKALTAAGRRAASVVLDITDAAAVAPAFDEAERQFGAPVDLVINNAGIISVEMFLDQTEEAVARVIDTNLKGTLRVAQEAAKRMAKVKRGVIINVASTAGLRTGSFMAAYGASKAGLIHASKIMALELAGRGIRVNVLCPGNIESEMQDVLTQKGFKETMLKRTPMRRYGEPSDLDGATLLLASDAGRYITGIVLTVDGGQTLSWM